jgi:RNA polymerase sigma factor (sigma-70 family)
MANRSAMTVPQPGRAPAADPAAHLSDGQLLERFTRDHEQAAFEALVRRHGPLVLGVCRRVLQNGHDAEDAFQTTFLTLARKAGSIWRQQALGGWLYRVAHRVAVKARASAARRRDRERQADRREPPDPLAEVTGRELLAVLDAELDSLPECYRAPLVLCCLEGRTRDEAAQELGWSLGTLKRRLEQGRERLRGRLARRGLALSAALAVASLSPGTATAAVPPGLAATTVQAALAAAAGRPAAAGDVATRRTSTNASTRTPSTTRPTAFGRNAGSAKTSFQTIGQRPTRGRRSRSGFRRAFSARP